MPGEYSPSVARPGAVPSFEKLVPGRPSSDVKFMPIY